MGLTKINDARHELHCLTADLATLQRLVEAREAELRIAEARGTAGERSAARVRHNLAKAMLDEHRLAIREQRAQVANDMTHLFTAQEATPWQHR